MNNKKILAVIIVLALVFRIVFALIVPIFEKPDEKAHFEYIQFVAENKKLPVQTENDIHAEFFQPPFYHYFASFIFSFIRTFTQNIWHQIVLLRFISIFFSMLTLCLIYKISSLLFDDKTLRFGILAFASFLPSYINFNSAVTNSNFADFLMTLIIYLLVTFIMKGIDYKKIFLLGIIVGISLITRLSVIPLTAVIPFVLFIKHYPNVKKIIKPLIIIFSIALIISGWYFLRNFNLYGDFLGINAMKLASPPDDIKVDSIFVARLLGWTFITFWASFGRTNGIFIGNFTSISGMIIFIVSYLLLLLVTFAAFYGLYKFLRKYRNNKNILNDTQKKAFIVIIFYLALLGLSFISFNFYNFQPQGRLFFPAISTIAIFFTFGMYNLFNRIKRNEFLLVYMAFFIILDVVSVISISHYYL